MDVIFDPAKDAGNRRKHGVSLADAAQLDWDSVVSIVDGRYDYGEVREIGYGRIQARVYCVVYVRVAGVRRVIGFRKANSREVHRYDQQTAEARALHSDTGRGSGH